MAHASHAHTHEEQKKFSPKSEVKEVGPCKLQISIEVSADRVQEEIDHKYKDLNDSMALPGFRKGHAPRNVLERKFGKALLDDLKFERRGTARRGPRPPEDLQVRDLLAGHARKRSQAALLPALPAPCHPPLHGSLRRPGLARALPGRRRDASQVSQGRARRSRGRPADADEGGVEAAGLR